jgi:hypothetical protein
MYNQTLCSSEECQHFKHLVRGFLGTLAGVSLFVGDVRALAADTLFLCVASEALGSFVGEDDLARHAPVQRHIPRTATGVLTLHECGAFVYCDLPLHVDLARWARRSVDVNEDRRKESHHHEGYQRLKPHFAQV